MYLETLGQAEQVELLQRWSACQTPAPTGEGGCKEAEAAFYKEAKPSLFSAGPPLGEQQREQRCHSYVEPNAD